MLDCSVSTNLLVLSKAAASVSTKLRYPGLLKLLLGDVIPLKLTPASRLCGG